MRSKDKSQNQVHALTEALAAPFAVALVMFKPAAVNGNRCLALAYVDARTIQDRLDEVLGVEGWQDDYEILPDGSVLCRLQLRLGDEWVTKVDVGGPSEQPDGGDRLKAAFSDALKRAAVKFGIGRYLYRLPSQWVDYDPKRRQIVQPPALPSFARPAPGAKAAPVPAQSASSPHNLPVNGEELRRRLQDYEARLASQGLCQKGELIAFVADAGVKAGHGPDVASWSGPAILLAVEQTRTFETHARQRQATRKAVA
jgi:hypothetical protein